MWFLFCWVSWSLFNNPLYTNILNCIFQGFTWGLMQKMPSGLWMEPDWMTGLWELTGMLVSLKEGNMAEEKLEDRSVNHQFVIWTTENKQILFWFFCRWEMSTELTLMVAEEDGARWFNRKWPHLLLTIDNISKCTAYSFICVLIFFFFLNKCQQVLSSIKPDNAELISWKKNWKVFFFSSRHIVSASLVGLDISIELWIPSQFTRISCHVMCHSAAFFFLGGFGG